MLFITIFLPCLIATTTPEVVNEVTSFTPPPDTISCTNKNCIFSYLNIDETYFNTISTENMPGVLLVKFQSCRMNTLPSKFFQTFPMVVYLIITSPGVEYIDENTFNDGSELQSVNLSGNKIEIVPSNAFRGAHNLNEIDLSDNLIQAIMDDAFSELNYLEELDLSGNKISVIYTETLRPLKSLTSLNLAGNLLESVDGDLFIENDNLMALNLKDNRIRMLYNGFSKILPRIKSLSVMNNPCTIGTMLEKFPILKLMSGKPDKKAVKALKRCYFKSQDPESTDLFEINERIPEDKNFEILTDLTERLREKDVEIEQFKSNSRLELGLIVFMVLLIVIICITPFIAKSESVRAEKLKEIKIQEQDKKSSIIEVDPKQVVYTIDL